MDTATVQALASAAAAEAVSAQMETLKNQALLEFENKSNEWMASTLKQSEKSDGLQSQVLKVEQTVANMNLQIGTVIDAKVVELQKMMGDMKDKIDTDGKDDHKGSKRLRTKESEKFMPEAPWHESTSRTRWVPT